MQVRDYPQFRVRLPLHLLDQLKYDAKNGYRSLNSEIIMILENHFENKEKAPEHGLENRSDASHAE